MYITQIERQHIINWCVKYEILKYTIHNDGTVDVDDEETVIDDNQSTQIPIKFGKVKTFRLSGSRFESLINSPYYVDGAFCCDFNNLTSLEGAPKIVKYFFACDRNKLTSLEHFPEEVGGSLYLRDNDFDNKDEFYDKIMELIFSEKYPSFTKNNFYDTLPQEEHNIIDSMIIQRFRKETLDDIINSID